MITKEQAFGMYKHIAKIYYINDGHPEIKYDWNWGDISSSLNLSGFGMGDSFCCEIPIDDCKLILRPFESMTDEEMSRFNSYYKMEVDTKNHYKLTPKSIGYLISIGIDVFNLKERGWAVYESDLKGENNETN